MTSTEPTDSSTIEQASARSSSHPPSDAPPSSRRVARSLERYGYTVAVAASLITLMIVGYLLRLTSSFTLPLAIAAVAAVLVHPAQEWLERRGAARWLSTLLIMVGVMFAMVSVLGVSTAAMGSVASKRDVYAEKVQRGVQSVRTVARERFGLDRGELASVGSSGSLGKQARAVFGTVTSTASATLFLLLFLGFILATKETLNSKLTRVVRATGMADEDANELVGDVATQVRTYLWLKTIISIVTGAIFGLVAWAFGLDFPLVWGVMGTLLNYIPSLGPLIASLPPMAVAYAQFSPAYATIVVVAMATVQFVSGNVVEPKVLGDRLKINFIMVLISISVWNLVWGFPGMVLAVPFTACLTLMLRRSRQYRALSAVLGD